MSKMKAESLMAMVDRGRAYAGAGLVLWDNYDEDGDVRVRSRRQASRQSIPLMHAPTRILVPYVPGPAGVHPRANVTASAGGITVAGRAVDRPAAAAPRSQSAKPSRFPIQ